MKTQAQNLPSATLTLPEFVQQIMLAVSARLAAQRSRRQRERTRQIMAQMDDRLLDDIGVTAQKETGPLEGLAQMNPAFLAATAFCLPGKNRR
jgi:uncharacterized protein YjiS (DUF1127 family)